MAERLPDLVFFYHDEPRIIAPSPGGGYDMDCPKCGKLQWLESHPTEGHAVWKNERGNVSVQPSIVCAMSCGLHIIIENGVARDV